jgi:hypothetical protein
MHPARCDFLQGFPPRSARRTRFDHGAFDVSSNDEVEPSTSVARPFF